jgi:hypothetical protein
MSKLDEILDVADVAALVGATPHWVRIMRYRDETDPLPDGARRMPAADWVKSNRPIWRRDTIVAWAKETGRIRK